MEHCLRGVGGAHFHLRVALHLAPRASNAVRQGVGFEGHGGGVVADKSLGRRRRVGREVDHVDGRLEVAAARSLARPEYRGDAVGEAGDGSLGLGAVLLGDGAGHVAVGVETAAATLDVACSNGDCSRTVFSAEVARRDLAAAAVGDAHRAGRGAGLRGAVHIQHGDHVPGERAVAAAGKPARRLAAVLSRDDGAA